MRYAMAVDVQCCMGCMTCVVSCQMNSGLRPGMARTRVDELEWGRWPDGGRAALPHGCLHCDEPRCVRVCPTGASAQGADGIVAVDGERCIGCGVCVTACAYGARTIPGSDTYFFGALAPAPYEALRTVPVGVADKCDFCRDRMVRGAEPACVRDCPASARLFGDVDDPASPIGRFAASEGVRSVAGRGFFYGGAPAALDGERAIREGSYRPAPAAIVGEAAEGPEANPVVLGAAAVAVVAAGAGLAAYKQRS